MSTSEPVTARDGIDLLIADHRTVEQLFTQIESGNAPEGTVDDVIRELSIHAAIEEQVLYPAVRRELGDGDEMAEHSLEEHQEAKELLTQLDQDEGQVMERAGVIARLIQAVREHVEEEESDIFPRLRNMMSAEALVEMGEALEKAKKMAPTRPHPHAPSTPPGNVVAGAAAGLVDRVRDAIKDR